jgi:hypothetical protein
MRESECTRRPEGRQKTLMATAKRYPIAGPGAAGRSGAVWTASLEDGRPAVVLYGGAESGAPGIAPVAGERLARAGFTAVATGVAPQGHSPAELAAVCAALARGDLVPGLGPPAQLVVLGYGDGAEPARAVAAEQASVFLVTWRLSVNDEETGIEAEMVASGSHVVERSLQLDEALDRLLAWLARVM